MNSDPQSSTVNETYQNNWPLVVLISIHQVRVTSQIGRSRQSHDLHTTLLAANSSKLGKLKRPKTPIWKVNVCMCLMYYSIRSVLAIFETKMVWFGCFYAILAWINQTRLRPNIELKTLTFLNIHVYLKNGLNPAKSNWWWCQ